MAKAKKRSKLSRHLKRHLKKSYPVHLLAAVLMVVVFVEGMVFGGATAHDVNTSLQVLDMSASVAQTVSDLQTLAAPVAITVHGVDQFYEMAATETIFLLDNNIVPNMTEVVDNIIRFYSVASREMALALDLSDQFYPASAYASGQ
jgi:hypothetical protein